MKIEWSKKQSIAFVTYVSANLLIQCSFLNLVENSDKLVVVSIKIYIHTCFDSIYFFFKYFTNTGKNHWSGYDAWWDSWFKRIVTKDHMEVWFSKRNKWEKLRAQRWYWNVSIDILHWFCICFLYHLLQLSLKNDVLKCSAHHSKFCVVKNQYLKCVILKDTKNWLISKILHLSLFV